MMLEMFHRDTLLLGKVIMLLISAETSQKGCRGQRRDEGNRGGSAAVLPAVTRCWGWNESKLGDKRGQERNILLTEKKYTWD